MKLFEIPPIEPTKIYFNNTKEVLIQKNTLLNHIVIGINSSGEEIPLLCVENFMLDIHFQDTFQRIYNFD